jgi:hypothetical protein
MILGAQAARLPERRQAREVRGFTAQAGEPPALPVRRYTRCYF